MKRLLLFLLCSVPSFAQWALVTGQTANNSTAAASSLTCTLPSGAGSGHFIGLWVTYFGSTPAATPVTDGTGGNTWTQSGTWHATSGAGNETIFYTPNTTSGTKIITYHQTASAFLTLACAEFSGGATTTPQDVQTGTAGASSPITPGSITPSVTGDLILWNGTTDNGVVTASPASFTNVFRQTGTTRQPMEADFRVYASVAALNATSTFTGSDNWAANVVGFKQASGGAATINHTLSTLGVGP